MMSIATLPRDEIAVGEGWIEVTNATLVVEDNYLVEDGEVTGPWLKIPTFLIGRHSEMFPNVRFRRRDPVDVLTQQVDSLRRELEGTKRQAKNLLEERSTTRKEGRERLMGIVHSLVENDHFVFAQDVREAADRFFPEPKTP
jgi:hypothetical protein